MSVYESKVIEENKNIEKKIKALQKLIKPVERPIVKKYLPFPYEVNVLILDKLEFLKQEYYYKLKTKNIVYRLLYNFDYFTEPYEVKNRRGKVHKYKSWLDFEIRNRRLIENFDYREYFPWVELINHIYKEGINNLKLEYEGDVKYKNKVFNEMIDFKEKLEIVLRRAKNNLYFINNHLSLRNYDTMEMRDRFNREHKFKIFSNGYCKINSKQYNLFLQEVASYIDFQGKVIMEFVNDIKL